MIEEYKFGSINIDGKIYQHDIGINWAGEIFLMLWNKDLKRL